MSEDRVRRRIQSKGDVLTPCHDSACMLDLRGSCVSAMATVRVKLLLAVVVCHSQPRCENSAWKILLN